jgi:anti-sigma-K factor RskA
MRARIDNMEQQLAQAQSSVAFLTGSGTDCFGLAPTGAGDSTLVARACFSPSNGEALVVLDHATAPSGKDLELWVLRGDTPSSLGLVRADASGHAVIHLPALANASAVTAFAVSVEETGGSKGAGPQGPVVSVGALKG